jgi:N-acetylneuraminic acid mutarotase
VYPYEGLLGGECKLKSLAWIDRTPVAVNRPNARSGLAAAAVDGMVYAFGGVDRTNQLRGDFRRFDTLAVPVAWSDLSSSASRPPARYGHGMAGTAQGTLWLFGGTNLNSLLDDLWAYYPTGQIWRQFPSLPNAPSQRYRFGMASSGNLVFVLCGSSGTLLDELYMLNTSSNSLQRNEQPMWTDLRNRPNRPSPREYVGMAIVGDIMYVFGGYSINIGYPSDFLTYNIRTGVWSSGLNDLPGQPVARQKHGMVASGRKIFIFGGEYEDVPVLDDLHEFDTVLSNWTNLRDLVVERPSARCVHVCMYMCMYVCMYVCVFIGVHASMFVYVCLHAEMYVHESCVCAIRVRMLVCMHENPGPMSFQSHTNIEWEL